MPCGPILHASMPGFRCGSTSTTSTVSPCTSATSGFTNNLTEIHPQHLQQKRREEFCRSAELLSPFGSLKACDCQLLPNARPYDAHPLRHSNKMPHTAFQTIRDLQDSVPKATPPQICQATPRICKEDLSLKLSVPGIPLLKAQIKKREPSRLPLSPGTNP